MQGGNIEWLRQRSRKYIASEFGIEIEVAHSEHSTLHIQNYRENNSASKLLYKLYQENLSVKILLKLYSTFAVFSSFFTGAADLKSRHLDALFGVYFLGNLNSVPHSQGSCTSLDKY